MSQLQLLRQSVKNYSDTKNFNYISSIPKSDIFTIAFDMKLYNVLDIFKNDQFKDELLETVTFLFKQKLIEGDYLATNYLIKNFLPMIDWNSYFPTYIKEKRNKRIGEEDDGIFSDIYEVQQKYLNDLGFYY